ncbi:hypothetical protein E1B28_005641 [Marasmius oreades]|uniref:Copper transport protein n=1 Tax=Marasmius oreades TaxID=181124 RepID=A0A9P7UVU2_9AGAR|nr:uncharacterized protein E1B28_005641 [Marasmius oreades]KAG7094831.1 hypothetical protein E1B28_005641 [Marasmius oreades]
MEPVPGRLTSLSFFLLSTLNMDHSDMGSMGNGSTNTTADSMSMMMMMVPYLHFTKGDAVLFKSITPSSAGAIFGTCLIFFLFAVLERWLHAYRRGVEFRFVQRSRQLESQLFVHGEKSKEEPLDCCDPPASKFILTHELSRALLTGSTTTLHYLLMLVAMTFNASYIISIILGSIVGEFAFGRLYRR